MKDFSFASVVDRTRYPCATMASLLIVLLILSLVENYDKPSVSFPELSHHYVSRPYQQQRQNQRQQQQQHQPNQQILLSGDVHLHPGPSTLRADEKKIRRVAYPCVVCAKGVTKASKAISCDSCEKWTHVRCSLSVSLSQYNHCVKEGGEIAFICDHCSLSSLPFSDDDGVDGYRTDPTIASSSSFSTTASSSSTVPQSNSSSVFSSDIPRSLLSKGLHLLHSNVRSLLPKLPDVRLLLSQTKATVFAVSETWLDSTVTDGEVSVPGFNIVRRDRNRNGGGVAIFIRDSIAFNIRPDLAVDGLEAIWIELLLPRTKGILVCSLYRPPNDSGFLPKLEHSLSKIAPGTEFHILGDMNIDFFQSHSPMLSKYIEILDFFGCSQLIAEPTRITPTTSSLIDHVCTNVVDLIVDSGVIPSGFSDHLITFCSRRVGKESGSNSNVRYVRSFKNYSRFTFLNELKKVDWSSILSSADVNYCLQEFNRLFRQAIDSVAPL